MSPPKGEGLLFRDSVDVQPPDLETEETKASDANPYHKVLPPKFLACPKADPWAPVAVVEEEVVATTTKKKKDSKIQRAINSALEHPASTVLLMVMTFWSLFSDDIRVAALTKEVDVPFAIVTLVFMAIFLLETILRSWVALGFFLSFNFWLDLIATASMVLDFEVLWGECASVDTPCCLFRDAEVASEDEALAVLGSIQTATRIGRVLRLFRVVRVFRLIALIGKKQKEEEELKPSAVGKRYNELIVMKVVITVVLTLLVNQQLEPGELDLSIEFGLRMLTLGYNTSSFTGMVSDYEVRTLNMTFQELMVLNVEAATEYPAQKVQGGCYFDTTQAGGIHPVQGLYCCPERRATEIKQYIYNQTSMAAFDVKLVTRSGGLHNIVNTIFLALLLTTMFFLFSRDVTKMVVRPIESMIDIVRKLAENPSLTLAGQSKSKYETESVRVALAKIVGLMQLGFGGAGHEIISANLADSSGQNLDLMRRGRKVECAYGYCDIRQFTDTVECLQDQVMLFTNSVGEIIHQACNDNRGEPNKNIGDAFLIVWRPAKMLDGSLTSHTKIVDGARTDPRIGSPPSAHVGVQLGHTYAAPTPPAPLPLLCARRRAHGLPSHGARDCELADAQARDRPACGACQVRAGQVPHAHRLRAALRLVSRGPGGLGEQGGLHLPLAGGQGVRPARGGHQDLLVEHTHVGPVLRPALRPPQGGHTADRPHHAQGRPQAVQDIRVRPLEPLAQDQPAPRRDLRRRHRV